MMPAQHTLAPGCTISRGHHDTATEPYEAWRVWQVRHIDGELAADCYRLTTTARRGRRTGNKVLPLHEVTTCTITNFEGWHVGINTPSIGHAASIARIIGIGRGTPTDLDIECARIITAIAGPSEPIPGAPHLLAGEHATAVGAITTESVISRLASDGGVIVFDAPRDLMVRSERRRGGLIVSVSEHPQGRIYACVADESGDDRDRCAHGLRLTHLTGTEIHVCGDACPSCPRIDTRNRYARSLWRRCWRVIAAQQHGWQQWLTIANHIERLTA